MRRGLQRRIAIGLSLAELAGAGQNVHGLCNLRIAAHDEDPVANHATMGCRHEVDSHFELDESAVLIDHRCCDFERRIGGDEITKRFEHRIGDFEIVRREVVPEF